MAKKKGSMLTYRRLRAINLVSLLICFPVTMLLMAVLLSVSYEESRWFRIPLWMIVVVSLFIAWRTQILIERGWLRCRWCNTGLRKSSMYVAGVHSYVRCHKCLQVTEVEPTQRKDCCDL